MQPMLNERSVVSVISIIQIFSHNLGAANAVVTKSGGTSETQIEISLGSSAQWAGQQH